MSDILSEVKIVTCNHGHIFAMLPDHPMTNGKIDCPHCLKISIIQFERYLDME